MDKEKFSRKTFLVEVLLRNNPSPIDEAYAMITDITLPPVVVQLSERTDKLIDGNHRLFRARKSGVREIECLYLTMPEHIGYICNFDAKVYSRAVENW